jgi:hypothetical protein
VGVVEARHPDAGFRYAREDDERAVLRASFAPTTEFCPQAETLALGSFRALNGLEERHEFDLVRVHVAPVHQHSRRLNAKLSRLADTYVETGSVPDPE